MAPVRTALCGLLLAVLVAGSMSAAAYRKRDSNTERQCINDLVCGWAVYKKTVPSLPIDYYVRNECSCPEDKKCVYDGNDVSTNSYIYRCKTESGGGHTFPDTAA